MGYFRSLIPDYNCISSPQKRRRINRAAFLVDPVKHSDRVTWFHGHTQIGPSQCQENARLSADVP
jgi:hypothetical protein